jgi:hypothetical protein
MRKIPTIFERDWDGNRSLVVDTPHPDCDWVFRGEGVATRKYDGMCCKVSDGELWKRREIKNGSTAPDGFVVSSVDTVTGKTTGWVKVSDGDPDNRYFLDAFADSTNGGSASLPDGTYELLGPRVQGNPEGFDKHILLAHASAETFGDCPRTFAGLRDWLAGKDIEGVVFHHPDGRMAKIKGRDFGLKRKHLAA